MPMIVHMKCTVTVRYKSFAKIENRKTISLNVFTIKIVQPSIENITAAELWWPKYLKHFPNF